MVAGPSASWSWFPAALAGAGPAGTFVDDPFDPFESTIPLGASIMSLLDELDLSAPIEAAFEPTITRPSADLDDPFAWRPVQSSRAEVERAFADAVDESDFKPVTHTDELAGWSLADIEPSAPADSMAAFDELRSTPAEFDLGDLDELDELGAFEQAGEAAESDGQDAGDDDLDAGSDWFDL